MFGQRGVNKLFVVKDDGKDRMAYDELDDLLMATSATDTGSVRSPKSRKKAIVGGSDCEVGPTASLMRRIATERLRCTKCAQLVLRFVGFEWSDSATYMHFRNFYPDEHRLLERATKSTPKAAYCCQCHWISVDTIKELRATDGVPWVVSS